MGAKVVKQQKQQQLSKERSCAEALMMACDERLGAQSPAALMVCDTFLARDFWTSFVHPSFAHEHPPAASQVWAWGRNDWGQLGLGDKESRTTPTEVTALHGRCIHAVACGLSHTMAVVDDGELWATGFNTFGQLGLGDKQHRSTFTRVSGLTGRKVAAVACGGFHTLALLESGELFSWGFNNEGQLGIGDATMITAPSRVTALGGKRVAAIAAGISHSGFVLDTGIVLICGSVLNEEGVSVFRTPTLVTSLSDRRIVSVACGDGHAAAIDEFGKLFSWGWNEEGQLGVGHCVDKNTPQFVKALRGRPVTSVSCGYAHTLALLSTGGVFSWGLNSSGQLGLGDFVEHSVASPQQVRFFDGKRVKSVHCGGNFSAAVLETGELFLWGDNSSGQLGTGEMANKAIPAASSLARKHIFDIRVGTAFVFALVL